jgi:5-methylcytosine-specific restriction endonuclease McrA
MEWRETVTRQNFTPKTKAAIRERSQGRCEVHLVPHCMYPALPETCSRPGAEVDHITPDVFDGGNQPGNGAFLCETCHKIKTYTDNREAKKSNRVKGNSQADKRTRAKAEGKHRGWPSRPFPERKQKWPKRPMETKR